MTTHDTYAQKPSCRLQRLAILDVGVLALRREVDVAQEENGSQDGFEVAALFRRKAHHIQCICPSKGVTCAGRVGWV